MTCKLILPTGLIFHVLYSLLIFFKITFLELFFQFEEPKLGPKRSQRLSAEDTSRHLELNDISKSLFSLITI